MSFVVCYSKTAEENGKTYLVNRFKTFNASGRKEARKVAEANCEACEFVRSLIFQ